MSIKETASALFQTDRDHVSVYFAPGRVNLIGEHTDYNGGYVFPAALTKGTSMAIAKRSDQTITFRSAQFDQIVTIDSTELAYDKTHGWANYPKGVLVELQKQFGELPGLDFYFDGNIPNGAGLSSSASIELVATYGVADLLSFSLTRTEMAFMCQRVENDYIGVNSGIMDQFAVANGQKNQALFLNCKTLDTELVPLELGAYKLVITNTNKRRGLADSKYNERRSECEAGVEKLRALFPAIETISDLTIEEWESSKHVIKDDVIVARLQHVVSENGRVQKAVSALKQNDLETFGQCMLDSHKSLRDLYEVTGEELDVLFDLQGKEQGCIGTRMTGAGFGGCTISIVHEDHIKPFITNVSTAYEKAIGWAPECYVSDVGDGVKALEEATI
ncbi:galactokinase [Aureibacillus halotolerans]|uniref:Galactokinase n=1 Tax=Aureibacillus halotolerans TaxID=1508390 RepID=A0A4R6U910_9BACI|nr:galactokinase [Aureibacillus halotolerans]TDQ41453.1 galactokinase [Aureibacillus halotolerans]